MTTTTLPIKPHHLSTAALGLGTFLIANNTYMLLNPIFGITALGFPLPSPGTDTKLVHGLTRMLAGTRIVVGAMMVSMAWHRNYSALGYGVLGSGIMSVVDGYVTREVCGKEAKGQEWVHWGSLPVSVVLGSGLLYLSGGL